MTFTFTRRGLVAGAALVAVTGMFTGAANAADTIKIGVITDETGRAAFYAKPVTQGVLLAVKEINAAGGVLGKKVELVIEDDGAKPDVSATKARKLVDAGVVAFISNSSSPATQQAQTVSLSTKTPHITPANSGETLATKLDNPYFFQLGPLASTQIKTLMSYTRSKKLKRVAVVGDNSGLSKIIAGVFEKSLKANGIEVVASQIIPIGSRTGVPQMQKVRAAKPEAIFQAGIVGPQMAQFFQAYHQLGMKQSILASFNLSIPAYLKVAKDLMEGVAFIDAYDPSKERTKLFIASYMKEYGSVPFSLPGYGYDGLYFIVDALKRAGSADKEKLRAAMASTKGWSGVMGAKGSSVKLSATDRRGFDPEGAVVRLIKDNNHGPAVHSGTR
jgi:branched-chain amino acid transport system substrate-binding protein